MLELRILPNLRDVPATAWDALLRKGSSPFVEHAWLSSLEDSEAVGAHAGWIPQHLALYDGGELVAAAPAYVKTNSEGEFVFDWSWADLSERLGVPYYPKLVLAVPFTPATGDRVLCRPGIDRARTIRLFADASRRIAKELDLSGVHVLFPREEEARAFGDDGFLLRYGVQYHFTNHSFSEYEDFLATLPQKKRTQIRRERKQPGLDGMTIRTLPASELTPSVAKTMYELYLTTVDKYHFGRRYLNEAFFELVRERFRDRLAWVVAEKSGEIVAGAFNVVKDGILYGRYWGAFEEVPFLHFNVCYYHGIEQVLREGLSSFNPGAGGEHKRVRGFAPTLTYSAHDVRHPRMRAILEAHLARERDAVRAYVDEGGSE